MLRREKKDVLHIGGGGGSDTGGAASSEAVGAGSAGAAGPAVDGAGLGGASAAGGGGGGVVGGGAAMPGRMGRKLDLVVWLRLSKTQQHIYQAFLHSDAVREALNSTKSPLAALTVLKKVRRARAGGEGWRR
jgi:hypothetical protein